MCDRSNSEGVIAYDGLIDKTYVGLCPSAALILKRMLLQKTIQFFSAAIERIDRVIPAKLFNFRDQRPS